MNIISFVSISLFFFAAPAFAELAGEDPEQLLPVASAPTERTLSYSDELAIEMRKLKGEALSAKKAAYETSDRVSIGNILMGRKIEASTKATTEMAKGVNALVKETRQNSETIRNVSKRTTAGFLVLAIVIGVLAIFVRRSRAYMAQAIAPVAQDVAAISEGIKTVHSGIVAIQDGITNANAGIAAARADLVGAREEIKNSFRRAFEELPQSSAEAVRALGEEERVYEISGKKVTIIPEKSRTGSGFVSLKVNLSGKRQVVNENVFDLEAEEVLEKFILGEFHKEGAVGCEEQKKVFSDLKEKGRITIEVI